jgi:hypothetical protein
MTREEREDLAARIAGKQQELTRKINDLLADAWGLGRSEIILTVVISVKTEGENDGSTLQ